MLKVNNSIDVVLVSLLTVLNRFNKGISIVNFGQVHVGWVKNDIEGFGLEKPHSPN